MLSKAYIKSKWGHFCDTDKLVNDMMTLLRKYGHRNSEHGVCAVLDEYFKNKSPLINLIATSPNYKGDMRIVTKEQFERENVGSEVYSFVSKFANDTAVHDCILSYHDKDGKTFNDYFQTGHKKVNLKDAAKAENILQTEKMKSFSMGTFATVESVENLTDFQNVMRKFQNTCSPTLLKDMTESNDKKLHFVSGMKTSRAFNKVCTHYGVDKWKKYNKEFAKYADMVSGNKRELYFIISLNPLDYLTMSFGKSWASCHTIDKQNRRHMANSFGGGYCNGTMSYMLDESSIVTYVLDSLDGDIHETGKLYRNMFHYKEKCFVQGRIYPQGNDGCTDLYKFFRGIVQKEFTPLLALDENKWVSREVGGNTVSSGNHYKDYIHFSSCRFFYPRNAVNNNVIIPIGRIGICPHCGREVNNCGVISHDYCG